MKQVRETPHAINIPKMILGVPMLALSAILTVAFGLGMRNFKLGVIVGGTLIFLAKKAFQKDRRILQTLWIAARFKPVYDPIKRVPFICSITKD